MGTNFANILTINSLFLIINRHQRAAAGPRPFLVGEKMTQLRTKVLLGIALVLFFLGCQKGTKAKNFILITLDAQRADYISAYNPANASTPNIDLMAREGILFKNAYGLIPMTSLRMPASFFPSRPIDSTAITTARRLPSKGRCPHWSTYSAKKVLPPALLSPWASSKLNLASNQVTILMKTAFPKTVGISRPERLTKGCSPGWRKIRTGPSFSGFIIQTPTTPMLLLMFPWTLSSI